ncbi:MAG TPA: LysR substrate-binding domain-containing protein [Frateuria sp.]|uniref:LysR substrate-binding domain-containing protein n=1 Tax=Frateuria sp. TaxID=2211372 RepID=UPI002D7F7392|nr:LysR substrate-binding domain-containing protein [Frateuria sp.]HET6807110.1 LysR substrate-binding domain-containing protein [Frateuria sp.]
MQRPNLDMDALRTLAAILRLGSLARAAERVGRSQSAVSQQMRKLEAQLGQPLFRKQGRRVVLTEAGDRVHAYALRILALNDEAVHAVYGAAVGGAVRFGLPGDFAESWLPAALGQFKKAYPAVRVDVEVERNGALLERLDRGELDLVLAMGHARRADAERLATLPMTWVGAADATARLRASPVIELALYRPPCFFRKAGTEALDQAGKAWHAAFVTSSLQSLWAGVAAGLGITLRTSAGIPPGLIRLDGRHGLPPLPRVDVCLHAAGDPESPALRQLRRTVTEHALAALAEGNKNMAR